METSLSRSAVSVGRVDLCARVRVPRAGRRWRMELDVLALLLAIGWALTLGLALVGLAAVAATSPRLAVPAGAQAPLDTPCGAGRWPVCLSQD